MQLVAWHHEQWHNIATVIFICMLIIWSETGGFHLPLPAHKMCIYYLMWIQNTFYNFPRKCFYEKKEIVGRNLAILKFLYKKVKTSGRLR